MKKHSMPDMKEGGVNVTPLIDVVMCLIIFFILVAKIGVSTGIDHKIDAPMTYLGVKIDDLSNALALNLYPRTGFDEPEIRVDLKGEHEKELRLQDKRADGTVVHPLRQVQSDHQRRQGDALRAAPVGVAGVRGGGRDQREFCDQERVEAGAGIIERAVSSLSAAKDLHGRPSHVAWSIRIDPSEYLRMTRWARNRS
jgi:hypothetical protein